MARFLKKSDQIVGKSPDDLVFVGKRKVEKNVIHIMDFDEEVLEEVETENPADLAPYVQKDSVSWISVFGLHTTEIIKTIGEMFDIHPLALEDILHTGQRPKFEEYDRSLYLVMKLLSFAEESETVASSQFSLVLGENFIITFHEEPVEIFATLRDRVRKKRGRARRSGPDYLAYAILDTVVDNYMVVLEQIGSRIEDIEDEVIEDPDQEVLGQITRYKREVNYLRKTIRPARELLLQLSKVDSELIREQSRPFWKDLRGIVVQATEVLELYREMLSDHLNIYNTTISNRLNEIMKVLTIYAAIFIPLTFIAGIYGTNFDYLPELHFKYSYLIFWGVLIGIALLMIRYFKRKKWM